MKLQPIESAPKDGSEILIGTSYNEIRKATWDGLPDGWTDIEGDEIERATHWCPLPTLEDDAELQAETAALVDAVKRFLSVGPSPPVCYDFHHRRSERHEIGESCTPKDRYFTALTALQQALAKHGKGAES